MHTKHIQGGGEHSQNVKVYVFEPCIVIYLCNKNQQNAHFYINYII